MCGIWAIFGIEGASFSCMCGNFNAIAHRGPDAMRIEFDNRIKVGLNNLRFDIPKKN